MIFTSIYHIFFNLRRIQQFISIKHRRCAFFVLSSLSPGCVVPPYPGLLTLNPLASLTVGSG